MPPLDPVIRRRRIRRLALLGVLVVLLGGGVAALYAVQKARHVGHLQQRVEDSGQAYAEEDYARVIELLEDRNNSMNVIRIIQDDPEALYRYVIARRNVPLNGAEHYSLLMPALQQVVTLTPENYEAGYMLLVLLKHYGRNTEALAIATRMIEVHPNNAELLRIRANTHRHLNDPHLALEDALASVAIEPMNVRTQMDVAALLVLTDTNPQVYITNAKAIHAAHTDDPRAELILAKAYLLEGDRLEANEYLKLAAQRPAPDDDFAHILTSVLDETNQFERAHAYLRSVAGDGLESPLQSRLLYRDFEADDDRAVLDRLEHLELDQMQPDLLAVGAISARQFGDAALSKSYLDALNSRENDTLASHWAACLHVRWAEPVQPGQIVAAASAACEAYPNQPYLQNMLGEAYRTVGESEAALRAFAAAIGARPTWATPYYMSGEVYLSQGNLTEAQARADQALRRKGDSRHAGLLVDVRAQMVDASDDVQSRERVLEYIDNEVLSQIPGEPRSTIVAIRLLARVGEKQAAITRLRDALALSPPLPLSDMVDLGEISRDYGLGYEDQIAEVSREAHGLAPQMILSQAQQLFEDGRGQEGLELIRQSMPTPATIPWRVAEAQFMDQIGDADALKSWIELADLVPEDLRVQQLALSSVGVQADRDFADRAIRRLRALAGEDSVGWKINRARYMLGSSDPVSSARQAQGLLEQAIRDAPRVEAYRLLAYCQTLRGQTSGAIQSIEKAAALSPEDMRIQFQLGQLLHNERQFEAARWSLQRVAEDAQADPRMRLHAFLLLESQGETWTLIPILEGFREQYITPDEQEILLARLYHAVSLRHDAEAICASLLEAPSPFAIEFVSDYYFRIGLVEESSEVVALVHTTEMPDDYRSTILGQHATRLGEPDVALRHYRAAANAAPDVPARWHILVREGLRFGNPTQAVADAKNAVAFFPNDAGLNAIVQHADLITAIAGDPRFRPTATTLVTNDEYREVGIQALQSVIDASRSGTSTGALAVKLAELADEHPGYLQIQNLATTLLSAVRRYEQAGEIATRTMMNFPNDGESARMATIAYAQTGNWSGVIAATESWTRRNPGHKPQADVYLAAAQRSLGRADDALETLAPYIAAALADPDANEFAITEYITALVIRGRVNDAWGMLEPNLGNGSVWRSLAVDLASKAVSTSRAAGQWLAKVELETPEDAVFEHLLLTQGYFNAGTRLRDEDFVTKARALSDAQSLLPDLPSAAWMLRGQITSYQGDLRSAEQSYREVLEIEGDSVHAKNNLVMVLVARGQNLDQAVRLAQEVVDAQPDTPNWLDTLAQAQSAAGQHEQALLTIEQAIRLDRLSMQWLATKANVLEAAGRVQEAQDLREQFGLVP